MGDARIPVHIVMGAPGSGKSALIARLCGLRSDWLGLIGGPPAVSIPNLRTLAPGCPCCTARIALQVGLVRALRETRARRAFVEIPGPEHLRSLEKVLGALPLGMSVAAARRLQLPADANLRIEDLESRRTR